MSKRTKKFRNLTIVFQAISIALLFIPMIVFLVIGFIQGEPHQKFTLGLTIMVAIILTVVNIIRKIHLRCILWILLLGISFCVEHIEGLLITMAITTAIDELFIEPLHDGFRSKFKMNYEMDKRGVAE